ncbi:MAG: helix-turn-helix domain-containing protein [Deltaproteobacteria bacterium]|nr:helix-turn-helix domain-containing protein [Deltaproteobacteria bacterium]
MVEKTHPESLSLESLGQLITNEREKAGLTRNDMASITRIAIDQIAKMEQGQFSNLPPVYARGFLKTLAGAMNLEPEVFLGEYRRLSGNKEESPSRPLQNKYVERDIIDEGGQGLTITAIIVLLILGVGVIFFFINPSFHKFVTDKLPFLDSEPATATPSASLAKPAPSPAARPATTPKPVPLAPASEAAAGGRLILRAAKPTWSLVVVDERDTKYVYFQPGQNLAYDSQKSVLVTAGDGQALKAEWNGQDLGFLGPQGPVELAFPRRD